MEKYKHRPAFMKGDSGCSRKINTYIIQMLRPLFQRTAQESDSPSILCYGGLMRLAILVFLHDRDTVVLRYLRRYTLF